MRTRRALSLHATRNKAKTSSGTRTWMEQEIRSTSESASRTRSSCSWLCRRIPQVMRTKMAACLLMAAPRRTAGGKHTLTYVVRASMPLAPPPSTKASLSRESSPSQRSTCGASRGPGTRMASSTTRARTYRRRTSRRRQEAGSSELAKKSSSYRRARSSRVWQSMMQTMARSVTHNEWS